MSMEAVVSSFRLAVEYPAGYRVRNTFIDLTPDWGSEKDRADDFKSPPPAIRHRALSMGDLETTRRESLGLSGTTKSAATSTAATKCATKSAPKCASGPPGLTADSASANCGECGTASEEAEVGSPSMPTVGSRDHASGSCQPCSFFFRAAGCSNGSSCPYCHLCDTAEKKRRQKEKKTLLKVQQPNREIAQAMKERKKEKQAMRSDQRWGAISECSSTSGRSISTTATTSSRMSWSNDIHCKQI